MCSAACCSSPTSRRWYTAATMPTRRGSPAWCSGAPTSTATSAGNPQSPTTNTYTSRTRSPSTPPTECTVLLYIQMCDSVPDLHQWFPVSPELHGQLCGQRLQLPSDREFRRERQHHRDGHPDSNWLRLGDGDRSGVPALHQGVQLHHQPDQLHRLGYQHECEHIGRLSI